MTDISTTIGTIKLKSCIYNAAGPLTITREDLLRIGESKSSVILSKSMTLNPRTGNPQPRTIKSIPLGNEFCVGSLNSEGLPNNGYQYYIEPTLVQELNQFDKPYMVSISGMGIEDNLTMLDKVFDCEGIAAIEINLACPNIIGKPMVAYDFETFDKTLNSICSHPKFAKKPVGLKLPPYFDFPHFEMFVRIIKKYPISFLVTINSIPNGLVVNTATESQGIVPKNGLGGIGGGFIKPTALANVNILYRLLKEANKEIDIIGVGGVSSGQDVFDMILCGANAVQVGTCHWNEGGECFERIEKEFTEIMKKKNYKSIEDFRGKLNDFKSPVGTPIEDWYLSTKELKERNKICSCLMMKECQIFAMVSIAVITSFFIGRYSNKFK